MLRFILTIPRKVKQAIAILLDASLIGIAYFGALYVRYTDISVLYSASHWVSYLFILPLTIIFFIRLGLYGAILRFINLNILKTVLMGVAVSSILLILISYSLENGNSKTVILIYFFLLTLLVAGGRLLFKRLINRGLSNKKVIIYGAGQTGRQLLSMLSQTFGYEVVAFVDDDRKLHKLILQGIKVYSPSELSYLVNKNDVSQVLLAIPSLSLPRKSELTKRLSVLKCEVQSVPSINDILTGKAKLTTLNKISIDDLLGREPVQPVEELLYANIQNKVVLVTGAGGSIGSELCRQIITLKPKTLVLFELSEFNLYSIEAELKNKINRHKLNIEVIPIMGTIQNKAHISMVMSNFKVDTIYHAAAYKHVPLVEYNVVEGCRNNVIGTLNCALSAIENNVDTFVLVSTDKAVRPTNTMGTTKRVAELILQSLAKQQSKTRFCMVRFGNVLGSSGSVVPLFRKQIESGGPITLTHSNITRYFMTIPEASQLVIQAGAMGEGGDVFVLDMGEPIKILDLAKRMIELSGLKEKSALLPDGDIEIQITGLRPGEKLYEELLIGDNVEKTSHPKIRKAKEVMLDWEVLERYLVSLDNYCTQYDVSNLRQLLMELPTEFTPVDGVCDLLWGKNIERNRYFAV